MKQNLDMFIIKKVLILFVLFSIIDLLFICQRFIVLIGMFAGVIVGITRFLFMGAFLSSLLIEKKASVKASIIKFLVIYGIAAVFFIASAMYNTLFFIGATIGILLVSLAVIINSVTEALGITHNKFSLRR